MFEEFRFYASICNIIHSLVKAISIYFTLFLIVIGLSANAQLLPRYGDSRTGTTGFQFLKINPDARSSGMGESNSATTDDLAATYLNPAGLSHLDTSKIHFQVNHLEFISSAFINQVAIGRKLSQSTFIAANLIYLNSGNMAVTNEFMPTGTGQTFRFTDVSLGVSLAKILTDNFSFGVTAKLIHEGVAGIAANNLVADFGFQYDIGKANTRFAVGIFNFGAATTPSGAIVQTRLNGDTTYTAFEKIAVPAVFRLGIATDLIHQKDHLLTINAQLNHPTDNNETYAMGLEYCWKKLLFGRMGYQLGVDESALPSFGFGILLKKKFGGVRIDYGFSHKKLTGSFHRIGLSCSIL
jgi:hypothetical protein